MSEEEALTKLAPPLDECVALLLPFDAFGDDSQAQALAQAQHCPGDRLAAHVIK